jgi:hypothetical protein
VQSSDRAWHAVTADDVLAVAEWPHRLGPFEAFGQRYAIWTTDADLASYLDDLYASMAMRHPDLPVPTDPRRSGARHAALGQSRVGAVTQYRVLPPAAGRQGAVLCDEKLLLSARRPGRLLTMLQWAINRQVIGSVCSNRLILHAGGVERDDAAVVLPAAMESGKTTLTAGLLDHGCGYLSDEAVGVGAELTVEGYPKPLSIDPGSWDVLRHLEPSLSPHVAEWISQQWQVPAQGTARIVHRSKLAMLVLPRYERGASTVLERLSPATVVREMIACVFSPQSATISTRRVRELAVIAGAVPGYRLVSGDLDDACAAVLGVLSRFTGR